MPPLARNAALLRHIIPSMNVTGAADARTMYFPSSRKDRPPLLQHLRQKVWYGEKLLKSKREVDGLGECDLLLKEAIIRLLTFFYL